MHHTWIWVWGVGQSILVVEEVSERSLAPHDGAAVLGLRGVGEEGQSSEMVGSAVEANGLGWSEAVTCANRPHELG